jgi:hypothetical protein
MGRVESFYMRQEEQQSLSAVELVQLFPGWSRDKAEHEGSPGEGRKGIEDTSQIQSRWDGWLSVRSQRVWGDLPQSKKGSRIYIMMAQRKVHDGMVGLGDNRRGMG